MWVEIERHVDWRGGAGRGAAKSDGAAVVVKWEENPREARLVSEWVRSAPSDQWATFFTLSIYTEFAKYTSFYLSIIHYTPFLKKYTKPVSEEPRSGTYSPLDRREIWLPRSKPNSEHSHHWELQKHVGAKRNTLHTVPFSFPAKTQNGLSKATIPVSITVGFSFNLDMLFAIQLFTLPPLGFAK